MPTASEIRAAANRLYCEHFLASEHDRELALWLNAQMAEAVRQGEIAARREG
jgi:hypothetical protein